MHRRIARGFTLVELMIVIIVIVILAVLVGVGYNGIIEGAGDRSLKSDLQSVEGKISRYKAQKGVYPDTSTANGLGLNVSNDATLLYQGDGGSWYCASITSADGATTYSISEEGVIRDKNCSLRWKAGDDSLGQFSVGTNGYACGLAFDGKVYCYGNNLSGELGNGGGYSGGFVTAAVAQGAIPAGASLKQVATGGNFACVLASNNKMYCWGGNSYGQLGDNTTTQRKTPVEVQQGAIPSAATIKQIFAGPNNMCALTNDGKLYCWGYNLVGALGDGTTTNKLVPTAVSQGTMPAGAIVRQVSMSTTVTCATITTSVDLYCWGTGGYGQLGNNGYSSSYTPSVVSRGVMPAGVAIEQVAVGDTHVCALLSNNGLYCWGTNGNGQIGDGSTTKRIAPTAVSLGVIPSSVSIRQVVSGGSYSCALASNKVYCWGRNDVGQLGNGSSVPASPYGLLTPVATVQGAMPAQGKIQKLVTVPNNFASTCAIMDDSSTYCWGRSAGYYENGAYEDRLAPVRIRMNTSL